MGFFCGNAYWCFLKGCAVYSDWAQSHEGRWRTECCLPPLVVCSIWKQGRTVGISSLLTWPLPTAKRTAGSNTLKKRMIIYKYFTISGRDKQLRNATDYGSVLTCEPLFIEHLVAEVVRLDPEVVSSHLSLVLENEKGHNSQHKTKHSKGYEDDVPNSHSSLLLSLHTRC